MRLPQPGETFLDRYELREVLGQGGFGTVFGAWDGKNQRKVVIKVLSPGHDGYSSGTVARFKRESQIFATFKSPNIVTMFDHGTAPNGLLYIVFEHVDGRDLKRVIAEQGPLDEKVTLHILRQLLDALSEAHDQGILHRDIKPDNVLVYEYAGDPWKVKLIDFGLAKDSGDEDHRLTQTGSIVGTMRYMPPEQLRGGRLGPESDLFSLGLVIYEMRTRSYFIEGESPDEMLKSHANARSIPLAGLFTERHIAEAINRLGVRDRSRRAASARTVISALQGRPVEERVAASQSMSVRRPLPEPSPGPAAQKKWMFIAGGVFIVLSLLGVLFVEYSTRTAPKPKPIVVERANPLDATPPAAIAKKAEAPEIAAEEEPTEPPPVAEKIEPCSAKPKLGWQEIAVQTGLDQIPVAYFLPSTYSGTDPAPLILVTSAYGPKSGEMVTGSGLIALSEREGFIVILIGSSSPSVVDVALEAANEQLCVDKGRAFSVNFEPYGSMAALTLGNQAGTSVVGCHPWLVASGEISSPFMRPNQRERKLGGCERPLMVLSRAKGEADDSCKNPIAKQAKGCDVVDCERPILRCDVSGAENAQPFDMNANRVGPEDWIQLWNFFDATAKAKRAAKPADDDESSE